MKDPEPLTTKVDQAQLTACCSAAYDHPAARWLLGESLHPGGLRLTSHLADLLDLKPGGHVLDAGCGRGASAIDLAATRGVQVTGVTLETNGVEAAKRAASDRDVAGQTTFILGDLCETPLPAAHFDAAIMECVLSILPDKPGALRRIGASLRPGGRLGLTDVTVSGTLPPQLQSVFAVAGCVGDARSLDGYAALVREAGLVVQQRQDLREVATAFLRELRGKLLIAEVGVKVGRIPVDLALVEQAKALLGEALRLVDAGTLSYGLIVAQRPR